MKDVLNTKIYTNLDEAKAEIQRRWKDEELKKKVLEYLGDIPEFFCDEPRAILHRHITSPNIEFQQFIDHSRDFGLKPLGLEYTNDIFLTRNHDKLGLGKLPFISDNKKNVHYRKVIDLMGSEKKKFADIQTLWGENLIDFHHNLLRNASFDIETADLSYWYGRHGDNALNRYEKLLAFFVAHGVLFENFITDEKELAFAETVVCPAIEKITSLFGVKPLIVPVFALDQEMEDSWWCYEQEKESFMSH
ncbi:MAG: hypothetical protein PHH40_00690 [Candidatus Moranbacteria bacterium]|nr:hypothetical protein [Candidatus Moranbacteria bacterium]MDD3964830.1 hypothetical protein [Candidatus Moranbacteria bacterium]